MAARPPQRRPVPKKHCDRNRASCPEGEARRSSKPSSDMAACRDRSGGQVEVESQAHMHACSAKTENCTPEVVCGGGRCLRTLRHHGHRRPGRCTATKIHTHTHTHSDQSCPPWKWARGTESLHLENEGTDGLCRGECQFERFRLSLPARLLAAGHSLAESSAVPLDAVVCEARVTGVVANDVSEADRAAPHVTCREQ